MTAGTIPPPPDWLEDWENEREAARQEAPGVAKWLPHPEWRPEEKVSPQCIQCGHGRHSIPNNDADWTGHCGCLGCYYKPPKTQ